MRQDAPGPTAPPSASFAVPPPPRKPARRLRRLLRALLLCLVLLLLLAGGGLGWLCTASGQVWLRETLNATLATALETSGLRLTVRKLEGLPFHPRLAVRGEDAAGRWLDLPDVALSWRLGWQDGLVLHLDPLALNGGGLYRLPQLPDSPPEAEPERTPGQLADHIGRSIQEVFALLGDLPGVLPRVEALVRVDKLALPPEWLGMLPPEAEDTPPDRQGTPDADGPFPRVSLELRLAGGLGSRADVRAELTAHAFWPQDEASPREETAQAGEAAATPPAAAAPSDDATAHATPAAADAAAPVTPPSPLTAGIRRLPEALLPLFGTGRAEARLRVQAQRQADGQWTLALPELDATAGIARAAGRFSLQLPAAPEPLWAAPLELALRLDVTPDPQPEAWAALLSGPASAELSLHGPLGAPQLSLAVDGTELLPAALSNPAAPAAPAPADHGPAAPQQPAATPVKAARTAPARPLRLTAPLLRLDSLPLRWRATLDGGTLRLALHTATWLDDTPLRADILLAAGLRRHAQQSFWRLSLEDISLDGAGTRLRGHWGTDLLLTDGQAPAAATPDVPPQEAADGQPAPAAGDEQHMADDIVSRRISAVLRQLPPMRGRLELAVTDWKNFDRLGALLPGLKADGQPVTLVVRASGRESDSERARLWGVTDWHLALTAPRGQIRQERETLLLWQALAVRLDLAPRQTDAAGGAPAPEAVPVLAADVRAERLEAASLRLVRPHVQAGGPLAGPLRLEVSSAGDVQADVRLEWQPGSLAFSRLKAELPAHKVGLRLEKAARLRYTARSLDCEPLHIRLTPSGQLQLSGRLAPDALTARLRLLATELAPWQAVVPALPQGQVALEAALNGSPTQPQGKFSLKVNGLHLPGAPLPPLDGGVTGSVRQGRGGGELTLALDIPENSRKLLGAETVSGRFTLPLTFSGGLPGLSPRAALKGELRWQGAVAPLWNLVPMADRRLSGRLDLRADLSGTLEAPALSAAVGLEKGRFEDVALGVLLQDIQVRAELARSRLDGLAGLGRVRLDASLSDGRKGRATFNGELSPAGRSLNLSGRLDSLHPLRRRDVTIALSGTASVRGPLTAPQVQADISVDSGEVRIDRITTTSSITTLPISETSNAAKPAPKARPAVGRLDARVRTTGRFTVQGRGLDSLWKVDIHAGGPLTDPRVTGSVEAVEGTFNFLNAKFNLYRGIVRFAGGPPSNPLLDVVLRHEAADIVADVRVGGTAQNPKFQLTSTPTMPQEEIISRIMFGRASSDLGRFENLRLAAAVAELAGFGGGGFNVLDVARKTLGVDVLRVGSRTTSDEDGNSSEESTLEAGKFIGEKLYLGVAQGMKPDSTAVIIELQMTPHSKAQVRTEQNNTSAGVRWKINY